VSVFVNRTASASTTAVFDAAVNLKTNLSPAGVAAADVNQDGKLDIAVAERGFLGAGTVSVLINTRP
jgi:hypothetical protein